jgi:hypothetical protein
VLDEGQSLLEPQGGWPASEPELLPVPAPELELPELDPLVEPELLPVPELLPEPEPLPEPELLPLVAVESPPASPFLPSDSVFPPHARTSMAAAIAVPARHEASECRPVPVHSIVSTSVGNRHALRGTVPYGRWA